MIYHDLLIIAALLIAVGTVNMWMLLGPLCIFLSFLLDSFGFVYILGALLVRFFSSLILCLHGCFVFGADTLDSFRDSFGEMKDFFYCSYMYYKLFGFAMAYPEIAARVQSFQF
jgi:hypothetical protein